MDASTSTTSTSSSLSSSPSASSAGSTWPQPDPNGADRGNLACVHCRRSKVRCVGGIPCTRCVRIGRKDTCERCKPKKRGRKPKQYSDSSSSTSSSTTSKKKSRTVSKRPPKRQKRAPGTAEPSVTQQQQPQPQPHPAQAQHTAASMAAMAAGSAGAMPTALTVQSSAVVGHTVFALMQQQMMMQQQYFQHQMAVRAKMASQLQMAGVRPEVATFLGAASLNTPLWNSLLAAMRSARDLDELRLHCNLLFQQQQQQHAEQHLRTLQQMHAAASSALQQQRALNPSPQLVPKAQQSHERPTANGDDASPKSPPRSPGGEEIGLAAMAALASSSRVHRAPSLKREQFFKGHLKQWRGVFSRHAPHLLDRWSQFKRMAWAVVSELEAAMASQDAATLFDTNSQRERDAHALLLIRNWFNDPSHGALHRIALEHSDDGISLPPVLQHSRENQSLRWRPEDARLFDSLPLLVLSYVPPAEPHGSQAVLPSRHLVCSSHVQTLLGHEPVELIALLAAKPVPLLVPQSEAQRLAKLHNKAQKGKATAMSFTVRVRSRSGEERELAGSRWTELDESSGNAIHHLVFLHEFVGDPELCKAVGAASTTSPNSASSSASTVQPFKPDLDYLLRHDELRDELARNVLSTAMVCGLMSTPW